MRRLLRIGLLALLGLAAAPAGAPAQEHATYAGAWFEIEHPAGFTVTPSLPSSTAEGFDSAFFAAPDGSVEFYVHAPQWGGEPGDIALDPETEALAAERIVRDGPVTKRWFTIAARDGSYARSYLSTRDARGPTSFTTGLRYASEEARRAYAAAYGAFARSLEQFAD